MVIEPRSATFQYEVEKQETPVQWNFGKIEGLADLHVHGAAHLGFGGLWLWGDHDGPQSTALRSCRQVDALDAVSIAAQIKGLPVPEKEKLHAVPLDQADHVGETVIRHGRASRTATTASPRGHTSRTSPTRKSTRTGSGKPSATDSSSS